jgi:hypothetical protein
MQKSVTMFAGPQALLFCRSDEVVQHSDKDGHAALVELQHSEKSYPNTTSSISDMASNSGLYCEVSAHNRLSHRTV